MGKLTQLFFTVPMAMAVLVLMVMLVLVIMAMLVLDITDMLVLDILDMLVLDMVVTTTESVRLKPLQKLLLRLKLIQLFFMVPMAMPVLDITDMLVSDIMDMLVLVITDMLVSDILDTVPTMASVQPKLSEKSNPAQ